ncbi:MAG: hydrogenase expression/formation protein HypE [Bacteroidales bacterium]|nr:hydrogenase expression/formation protein HypE [Bacteroidales bacterium]
MTKRFDRVLLSHGSGGRLMHDLIRDVFLKHFMNPYTGSTDDAAILPYMDGLVTFTTDSFVVDPLFFPGGNIGKLAVCGTINDLVAVGAAPYCLSVGFIIEEGLWMKDLEQIVHSMAEEANNAGILIATGDTKVVEKGKCDKLFINTSGIGFVKHGNNRQSAISSICEGDHLIITGYIADHGMAVMAARNKMDSQLGFHSDCGSLNLLFNAISFNNDRIKFMRDPTRGGLAGVLCELCENKSFGIMLNEEFIPVRPEVSGLCNMLGYDPLYVANEGKMVIIVDKKNSNDLLVKLKQHPMGKDATLIGEVISEHPGKVLLKTRIGGTRIVNMLSGDQLPRIC